MMPLLLLLACTSGIPLTADPSETLAVVDPGSLSFAIDTAQLLGGVFWNPDDGGEPEVPVDPIDLADPQLRALAAPLAPATFRVGGTAADFVFIDLSEDPVAEAPERYSLILTQERWAAAADFATELGFEMLFTLNAGPGPRGEEGGDWDPSQAEALIAHAEGRGDPVRVWELGNEVNAYLLFHGLTLPAPKYADDLAALAAIAGDAAVAGPASAYWPEAGEFVDFLPEVLRSGGEHLDVVTWHYYPQQSERCPLQTVPAEVDTLREAAALDEVATWAAEVEAARDAHAPHAEIWLGETGNAQCGGAPGVSDTFAGSLWWIDQLGLLSARGHQGSVRQTLVGSDYGLLDDGDLTPRPDYWVSLGWRWAMGAEVVSVTHEAGGALRAYAHCDGADLGLALVQLVDFPLDVSLGERAEWLVFDAEAADAAEVRVNGAPLIGIPDDPWATLMDAVEVRRGAVELPGPSVAFARVEGGCG